MKKAVKKVKKQQTTTKKTKNEITELRKLAYIFGSLVLIFLIFYGIAYLKLSNKENKTEYNRVVKALEDLEQGCREAGSLGVHNLSDCDEQINLFMGLLEKLK